MQLKDPSVPCFEAFLGEERVALLFEPEWADMCWCSYKLVPIDADWDRYLRNEKVWEQCLISIKTKEGISQDHYTFAGDYRAFCRRESDRIIFRSLWPPDDMLVRKKSALSKAVAWMLRRNNR